VGECFFWYRPTRVVPDQRPLNGRCCLFKVNWGRTAGLTDQSNSEQEDNTYMKYNEVPCLVVHDNVFINLFQPLQMIFWVTQHTTRELHSTADVHCLVVWTVSDNGRMHRSNCTHIITMCQQSPASSHILALIFSAALRQATQPYTTQAALHL